MHSYFLITMTVSIFWSVDAEKERTDARNHGYREELT